MGEEGGRRIERDLLPYMGIHTAPLVVQSGGWSGFSRKHWDNSRQYKVLQVMEYDHTSPTSTLQHGYSQFESIMWFSSKKHYTTAAKRAERREWWWLGGANELI